MVSEAVLGHLEQFLNAVGSLLQLSMCMCNSLRYNFKVVGDTPCAPPPYPQKNLYVCTHIHVPQASMCIQIIIMSLINGFMIIS